jgi:ribulose-5-phosphate 4-epimerase/fuculose-1-phosphate aldolase
MERADQIQRVRDDVVTCTRLLAFKNVLDYSGHVSARIPGSDELLLIQPRDTSRAALAPKDLLVVNLEGEVLDGEGTPPVETAIHTGIYRARPDVQVVCHGHPILSTTWSTIDRPLVPVRSFAYKLHPDGLPVHPYPTHVRTREQGDAVAQTLGQGYACLLRAHGTVVVANRIQELFMDCMDLEENAQALLYATQLGKVLPLTSEEVEVISESYARTGVRADKMWDHYLHLGAAANVL